MINSCRIRATKDGYMEWFKKHTDTVIILTAVIVSTLWMNNNFSKLDKEIAIIKTVLIMKNIMPVEMAATKDVK